MTGLAGTWKLFYTHCACPTHCVNLRQTYVMSRDCLSPPVRGQHGAGLSRTSRACRRALAGVRDLSETRAPHFTPRRKGVGRFRAYVAPLVSRPRRTFQSNTTSAKQSAEVDRLGISAGLRPLRIRTKTRTPPEDAAPTPHDPPRSGSAVGMREGYLIVSTTLI